MLTNSIISAFSNVQDPLWPTPTKNAICRIYEEFAQSLKFLCLYLLLPVIFCLAMVGEVRAEDIPRFGLFENQITNSKSYNNPFADVVLSGTFRSPSGKSVNVWGFYAGDGNGNNNGHVWKIRFMPDEYGTWTYNYSFSDSSNVVSGSFNCVAQGQKPGPWVQDPNNRRWIMRADGTHFMPIMVLGGFLIETDYKDQVEWCKTKGYNTILGGTFESYVWVGGNTNATAFQGTKTNIDYTRYNIAMWDLWDESIQYFGENNIYVAPFGGPGGEYGGQHSGKYPPDELVMLPMFNESALSETNKRLIHYLIARQGAFWNLANWSLAGTEVYNVLETKAKTTELLEYFASQTPWRRMFAAQDLEQWHDVNRRWISAANIPIDRRLNYVQTAIGSSAYPHWGSSNKDNTTWQRTDINNEFALDSYGGFPVIGTESLWECQGRARQPLSIIMGFFTAGTYTVWADWCYEDPANHRWGSLGRTWTPVWPLTEHLYSTKQIGLDCTGDEQLKYVSDLINTLEYWKMSPYNELAGPEDDVFCLAEPGRQYLLYLPDGGNISVQLAGSAAYNAYWFNPNNGNSNAVFSVGAGSRSFSAPNSNEWILVVTSASFTACIAGQTRSCATGVPGICSAGTETCTNGNWGTCVQNEQPKAEICGNNIDEDCSGSDLACPAR